MKAPINVRYLWAKEIKIFLMYSHCHNLILTNTNILKQQFLNGFLEKN